MSYQVVLPVFEGPLDLLLHLIDTHQLDIYNIPIAFITGQYMDYLKKAEEIDLNLSGDFLVMAGTLLAIKARMLLPQRPAEEQPEPEPDPRDELVEKLIAYRLFKENAQELKKLETSQSRIYYREVDERRLLTLFPPPNPIGNLRAADLRGALQELLRLAAARAQTLTYRKESLSLKDRMNSLTETLSQYKGGVLFHKLLANEGDVMEILTTFLALLELLSKGLVWVRQSGLFGEILVCLNRLPESEGEVRSYVRTEI